MTDKLQQAKDLLDKLAEGGYICRVIVDIADKSVSPPMVNFKNFSADKLRVFADKKDDK